MIVGVLEFWDFCGPQIWGFGSQGLRVSGYFGIQVQVSGFHPCPQSFPASDPETSEA